MIFLKKTWIIGFALIQVFFISKLYSSEIPHPTYPKFLEIFPNGYPKYTGSGNSKSIGAFRMYLQDLGYIIVDYEGTTIGFRYYVSDYNEVENKTLSNNSETNINAQNNNDTNDINELSFGSFNSQTTIEKRAEVESISLWVKEINFQIKKIIKYPKIAKDINLIKNTHKFVNEVTKSINKFHFNIAIASIRSLFNEINVYETISSDCLIFKKFAITQLIIIMYPICPHFCEEAWEVIGNKKRLSEEKWPKINEKYLKKDKIIIPIQINGKKRAEILVDENIDEAEIKKLTMAQKNIKKFISSDPKKIIFIPKRIVNIVI